MPTRRGWAVAAAGAGLVLTARALGVRELYEVGAGLIVLVLAAMWSARRGNREVRLERTIAPGRLSPGMPATVEVTFTNAGRGKSAPLQFSEVVPPALGRSIRLAIAPIEPRGRRTSSYEIVPARRGRYAVGPGRIAATDPFGLAWVSGEGLGTSPLTVYPTVETLSGLLVPTLQMTAGSPRPAAPTAHGEDFFTMREYQPGDDLKKVHWRSTARLGRLMIRQEEHRALGRATVVVDDRGAVHASIPGRPDFERVVESAASLVNLFVRHEFAVRLLFASGPPGSPEDRFGKGQEHERRLLERLAVAEPSGSGDPTGHLSPGGGARDGGGYVVLVATTVGPELLGSWRGRLGRFGETIVVLHPLHTFRPGPAAPEERLAAEAALLLERLGMTVITVPAGSPLAPAWEGRPGAHGAVAARAAR